MKIDFLGIPVDAITMSETIALIEERIESGLNLNHVVINAGKVVSMQSDRALFKSVTSCDMINADGQSIIWAARFLGKRFPGRVTGIDLMQHLIRLASIKRYKCFFLGATEDVVSKVVNKYRREFGSNIIGGYRHGYFNKNEEKEVVQHIANSGSQLLFVAMSSPKKEEFLFEHKTALQEINFTMGVGGSFDIVAGVTKRAPKIMQKLGLEWFYRLLQEPRRLWKRYLFGNTKFIILVFKEKYNQLKRYG